MPDKRVWKEEDLVLELRHTVHPHVERWYQTADEHVLHVISRTPLNSNPRQEGELTILEAMRQYILMTTTEGWTCMDSKKFHDLIEKIAIDDPNVYLAYQYLDHEHD